MSDDEYGEADAPAIMAGRDMLVALMAGLREQAAEHYATLLVTERSAFIAASLAAKLLNQALTAGGGGVIGYDGDAAEVMAVLGFAQAVDDGPEVAQAAWEAMDTEMACLMLWNLSELAVMTMQTAIERRGNGGRNN